MGKLHKTIKKHSLAAKQTEKTFPGLWDTVHFAGSSLENQYDATKAAEAAANAAQNEAAIPLPDEEELARVRRRRNARRGGGRASTVMSDEDRLGP